MGRTSAELTQKEIDAYQEFCTEHRIACDESEAGLANGTLVGEYIALQWGMDINSTTLATALEKLRDRLVFYTVAEANYKKTAVEAYGLGDGTIRANALNAWFHSPANNSLARDGKEGLQNQSALLAELRGREITPQTIQHAIGRAGFKSGLHYISAPRRVDPRQHTDDHKGLFPKDEVNLSPRDHAKRAAEAAAKASGKHEETPTTDYRKLAEGVKGLTHSRTEQIQKMFVTDGGKIDWEQTYGARRRATGL
jgi:hypothetical protein